MWNCSLCSNKFSSFSEFKIHCLKEHNSYLNKSKEKEPDLRDLTISTLESYRTTKSQVKFLLEKYPETRSDDKLLILKHLQCFQKALAYDPETKLIDFRNRDGITYEMFRHLVSFETITRCRRKLQEQFKELGASKRVALKRERREEVIHNNIRFL